jgi:hypothetical protein
MNAKTSKLLRRLAAETGQPYRSLKKLWINTPIALLKELRNLIKKDLPNANSTDARPSLSAPHAT